MPLFIPRFCLIMLLAGSIAGLSPAPQRAAAQAANTPPPARAGKPAGPAPATGGAALSSYDEKLMRLAEVLGSLHYLANLCPPAAPPAKTTPKAAEAKPPEAPAAAAQPQAAAPAPNMIWRDYMQQLLAALHSDERQNARLYAAFNRSYQSLAGNYGRCTPAAREALARYRLEGQNISAVLLENYASDY